MANRDALLRLIRSIRESLEWDDPSPFVEQLREQLPEADIESVVGIAGVFDEWLFRNEERIGSFVVEHHQVRETKRHSTFSVLTFGSRRWGTETIVCSSTLIAISSARIALSDVPTSQTAEG